MINVDVDISTAVLALGLAKALPDYAKLTGVPAPKPLHNFDAARARPYRPFRWEYHQNMSLSEFEPNWWIELESTYLSTIAQRKKLYADHGKLIIDELEGSREASRECMEMVIQYICQRYPNQFRYNDWTGVFTNEILHTRVDTTTIHPLIFLLEHVPEDFFIVQEDPLTGLYRMTAGIACSAIGWNISHKIGKPLGEIHDPVPDYKEKMALSVDRYFSKLSCDKPIQRGAWSLEVGEPLFFQKDSPKWHHRSRQDPDLLTSDIFLRVDWQTLRRLPRSRAIVFNFKALFTPITDFRREPYIPRLLLKVLREGKKSMMEYKESWHTEHKVIPALEEWAKEQEQKGWVPSDWKERTLDEHPFYPGWKDHYPIHD
ncbi:hypothetical protein F5J12DRAFT_904094 [Pisolithus orientalis]|uniref:uncharacterized protein n=1 Tax=Pisolithus orientalis TaxID=936130 RepID=UPI002225474B|nr:uncharacterized protein F5J12DRAFT_904094 [Pisolithus orientalis]KAI6019653.1 hypothetical protein F5J12DRAFT_904094 [Pisolithus orientalis]